MDLINVQQLFQQGMFEIPTYQRGYSWEKTQIEDFIEDLEYSLKPNVKQHFTGAITVMQQKDEKGQEKFKEIFPKKFKLFEVVDGQQRITTLTIFIRCIYNRLKKLNDNEEVLSDILKNIIYAKVSILQLNDESDSFYKEKIITGGIEGLPTDTSILENKSQKNLADAKKRITKYLDSKKTRKEIEAIYLALVTKFKVNFDILNDDYEVGIVFETMNNRGLPLKQIDKVKNYLIFLCSRLNEPALAKEINTLFGIIFKNLMRVSYTNSTEDDFLRYTYIIYTGIYKEADIHNEIKTTLFPKTSNSEGLFPKTTPKSVREYIEFLTEMSKVYAEISERKFNNSKISLLLNKLQFLGRIANNNGNFSPLLFAIFKKYIDGKLVENQLITILELLEVFSFRSYHILKKRSDFGQNILYRLANEFYKKNSNTKTCISEIRNLVPDNEDLKVKLNDDDFYNKISQQAICYFFYEYECSIHNDRKSQFPLLNFDNFKKDSNSRLSIEHIESQDPQNSKPQKYTHKLGNLVMTYDNAKLSNNSFNSKKSTYKDSKLVVENELSEFEQWTKDEVKERTKTLMQFAIRRWKL